MVDSSRTIIIRERVHHLIGLGLLVIAAFLAALLAFWPPTYVTDGQLVQATVVRIWMHSTGEGSGGDLPILAVRLPDGSIRQVPASWATAGNCLPGSQVGLRQHGSALQVGLRGCRTPTHSD
jgi:hypothetical protein